MPKIVDVFIVTYNRANYLRESINSVLKQTYKEFDLIILDNCSNDNTREVVEEFSDDRIKYIRHDTNLGGLGNICYAYANSTKKYFVIFHDDDVMKENYLEKQIDVMEKDSRISILSCETDIINEKSQYIHKKAIKESATIKLYEGKQLFYDYLYNRKYINFPTIMYRTEHVRKMQVEILPEAGPSADILYCMDVERFGGTVGVQEVSLVNYRNHSAQDSQQSRVKMVEMLFNYMNNIDYYRHLLDNNIKGQTKYYKRILFNELCLFGADLIDVLELKNDMERYKKVLKITMAMKLFTSAGVWICKKMPKLVRWSYKKLK
ncbi:MAG: glycosyltransferase family 2 protein [Lachnospiraceae bacterium]|nr:glycosyltransferase family 2 protein [Lachnospiraceae bacterium]